MQQHIVPLADRGARVRVLAAIVACAGCADEFAGRGGDKAGSEAFALADGTEELIVLVEAPEGSMASKLAPGVQRHELVKAAILRGLAHGDAEVTRTFEHLPYLTLRVRSPEALDRVLADPGVVRVWPNRLESAHLTSHLALIGQPAVAAQGKTGAGVNVAVIDTGVDWQQPAFGSCNAAGATGCKVVYAADFATDDGQRDAMGHGTNVAAIVLGVAPGAGIVALDVFNGGSASSTDVLSAINWVTANASRYHVAAINLSLGGGAFAAACPNDLYSAAVHAAKLAGVMTIASSGNEGLTNRIASPACGPEVVSVGAVYDASYGGVAYTPCIETSTSADKVTCFSNSASFLSLLAPGTFVNAGGYTMTGTSQAAPFVSGAAAVLRAAFPGETVDEQVTRLKSSGVPTTDARNGVVTPRLALAGAAAGCVFGVTPASVSVAATGGTTSVSIATGDGCAWTASSPVAWITFPAGSIGTGPATLQLAAAANAGATRTATLTIAGKSVVLAQSVDTTGPVGSLSINAGAAYTQGVAVTAALAVTDPSGVAQACLSNATTCTAWVPMASSLAWNLTAGSGLKTVRAWFKDARGNTSTPVAATITLDATPPTDGTASATAGDAHVDLSWSGFADAASGLASYRVKAATTSLASCATGTTVCETSSSSCTHAGLVNGATWFYRVCALDAVGNVSAGTGVSARPIPETNAPSGTIAINGGAAGTKVTAVTLTPSATDASGVAQICVSAAATCTGWVPYATSLPFTLATGNGARTVNAWFRDVWGNTTATPTSATIVLDTIAPTNGTAQATSGDASVTISWAGFADAGTGVASYTVQAASSAVASCAQGTTACTSTGSSCTHGGLVNGTTWFYRVCALDAVGNVSTGIATSARPVPEKAPPVGSITINGGAPAAKAAAVTIASSVSDESGVAQICLSATATCTAWVTYAASLGFTVAAGNGSRTVNAWFRDVWGNTTTTPATATIVLDTVLPTTGTATALAGDGSVAFAWTGFADAGTGIASYKVQAGTSAVANCAAGTTACTSTGTGCTHSGLVNGTPWFYRVCALDVAGNASTGVALSARPVPEKDAPVGTIAINGGASATKVAAVTITPSVTDASALGQICLSSAATCTAWVNAAATHAFNLAAGTGTRTVNAWFRDVWGNTTASPTSASILLDTAAPTNGTATATAGDAQVALEWSGFADALSGVASYKVVYGTSAPANCTAGTLGYSGAATSTTITGLTNGSTYGLRVCAVDAAGNLSSGLALTAKPVPERNAPSGSVVVNGGADYTRVAAATLTIAATDDTSVAQMCLSAAATCTNWIPYATTANFTLAATAGLKTVSAWFRDPWGNTSAPVTDTITFDAVAPANGVVTTTPGSRSVALAWSGFADPGSGVASYVVVVGVGATAPANCTGASIYDGPASAFTHEGLTAGVARGYRVCARDTAGNLSVGVAKAATPTP